MIRVILVLFLYFSFGNSNEKYHSVKVGILSHCIKGVENGKDLHLELQFKEKLLKAHYTVGVELNTNNTSFMFGGLAWEDRFSDNILLGAFFGIAMHNGDLDNGRINRRQLGSRILFRESIDIGFYFQKNLSISFMYDHYSNLGIGGIRNQGNDNFGIRLGYYF